MSLFLRAQESTDWSSGLTDCVLVLDDGYPYGKIRVANAISSAVQRILLVLTEDFNFLFTQMHTTKSPSSSTEVTLL